MSDLFHESVPEDFVRKVFAIMEASPQHTFQILTKRSDRLRTFGHRLIWPENVWMGVSVEGQKAAAGSMNYGARPRKFGFFRLNR